MDSWREPHYYTREKGFGDFSKECGPVLLLRCQALRFVGRRTRLASEFARSLNDADQN